MEPKSNTKIITITILITAIITGSVILTAMKFIGGNTEKSSPDNGSMADMAGEASQAGKLPNSESMDSKSGDSKSMGGKNDSGKGKVAYWQAPMNPMEIYDDPGKSKMGMDLVPVYEDSIIGGVDIKINPIVEQNMGLKIEKVQKGPLQHTIKTYGHITFDETRMGIISQKTGGWIEKLYADYTGLFIKKGQPLYEIYSPSLLSSQEEYLSAFRNYQRSKSPLNEEILMSAKKRISYFDIDDREIQAIEESGKVKKAIIVRSPFSGIITHKNITEGEYSKAGESLFKISDLSHVWVEAHIFEYEQNLVSLDQQVELTLSYDPGKVYKGKIFYIFPYLQEKTRDIIIRIDFENQNNELKPNMFARIKIKTDLIADGISIPSEAVIHSGEKKIVFVTRGGGKYRPEEIQTGVYLENGQVQVLSGLENGEHVVVSGQFLLDSESKLKEAIQKMIRAKKVVSNEGGF
jgi:Cu(I)/Ag(I) efflux system membrane fusion protein